MPARIRGFFHDSLVVPGSPPALGTAFDVADVHAHDLLLGAVDYLKNSPFYGRIEALHLRVTGAERQPVGARPAAGRNARTHRANATPWRLAGRPST